MSTQIRRSEACNSNPTWRNCRGERDGWCRSFLTEQVLSSSDHCTFL